jgi:hypothetical protein
VFISDSLHDRIIITDGNGGVLDYVGHASCISSPCYVELELEYSIVKYTSLIVAQ